MPNPSAIQFACQTTRPTIRGCRAPSYCATNVFAYAHTPSGRHSIANHAIDAEKAAAIAVPDNQLSIIRSMNVMSVHDRLDTMSGAATRRTSRPPAGLDHQEASEPRLRSLTATLAMLHKLARAATARIGAEDRCRIYPAKRPRHSIVP